MHLQKYLNMQQNKFLAWAGSEGAGRAPGAPRAPSPSPPEQPRGRGAASPWEPNPEPRPEALCSSSNRFMINGFINDQELRFMTYFRHREDQAPKFSASVDFLEVFNCSNPAWSEHGYGIALYSYFFYNYYYY